MTNAYLQPWINALGTDDISSSTPLIYASPSFGNRKTAATKLIKIDAVCSDKRGSDREI